LGSALRDCSNASTSPSSTTSSPRLVFLLVGGARLGVVKRAEVLIIAIIFFIRLSEEISSRVAECTRLILVKDGFGGDLGALDQCVDEHRKNTRI
jgi:hypothetical protein